MLTLKNVSLLIVFLLAVSLLLSCGSSSNSSPLPLTSIPSATAPTATEDPGPRFVITATTSPAFTPITIQPITIEPTSISPARDLTGTWRGTGVSFWIDGANGNRVARTTWNVVLVITRQAGNKVEGNLTMTTVRQEDLGRANIPIENYGPDNLENGTVTATTLEFNIGTWEWTFTFTTALMRGQYTDNANPGVPCDAKAFTLTRQ